MRATLAAVAAATLVLLPAPAAHAGTYTINACAVGEQQFGNGFLVALAEKAPVALDGECSRRDETAGIGQGPNTTAADDTEAALGFTAPEGTTIADFAVTRTLAVRNPDVPDAHNPYVIAQLGSTVFEGAGNYDAGTKSALGAAWYGGTRNIGSAGSATVGVANRPALAGYKGDANQLSFRVGCLKRGTPCTLDASGLAEYRISGLSVTLNDTTAPTLAPDAVGLLGGGSPSGATPVTVTGSDAAGIQSLVLIDVTDPATPQVVGGEVYDPGVPGAVENAQGRACTFRAAQACPQLRAETLVPTALSSGVRQLVVRATDPAGNVTDAGPYRVDVSTPSNRGALNGAGATEEGAITMGFTTTRKGSRTIDKGQAATIRGTLVNDAKAPIVGAKVAIYSRDTDAERYVRRATVTTGQSGRYAFKAEPPNSRYVRVVWVSHEFDTRTAATAAVKLRVRARASLSAPKRVSVGQRWTLKGKLKGASPPKHVKLLAEGYENGRFRTFAKTSSDGKGRFSLRTRLRNPSSRGKTFRVRLRIIPIAGWPYAGGTTRTVKVRVR